MMEPKARREMDDPIVLAKRDAAVTWCGHGSVRELPRCRPGIRREEIP